MPPFLPAPPLSYASLHSGVIVGLVWGWAVDLIKSLTFLTNSFKPMGKKTTPDVIGYQYEIWLFKTVSYSIYRTEI